MFYSIFLNTSPSLPAYPASLFCSLSLFLASQSLSLGMPLTNDNLQVAKSQAELDRAEAYAKDAKAAALKKVDEFDKKVEEGASKAKSGVSGWFGGK